MKKFFIIFMFVFSFFLVGCNQSTNVSKINDIPVNDIIINKSYAYVDIGEKLVLSAQVYPFNANNQNIIWKSDNSSIAEVSDGIVIGKSEGRTVITSISEDGNFEDKCILYVSSPKLDYNKYPNNTINNEINNDINAKNINTQDNLNTEDNYNNDEENIDEDFLIDSEDILLKNYFNKVNELFVEISEMNNKINNYFINHFKQNKLNNFENLSTESEENIQSDNKPSFYFYKYKFNSNGIDDNEDENTIYKDENTIVREYVK